MVMVVETLKTRTEEHVSDINTSFYEMKHKGTVHTTDSCSETHCREDKTEIIITTSTAVYRLSKKSPAITLIRK